MSALEVVAPEPMGACLPAGTSMEDRSIIHRPSFQPERNGRDSDGRHGPAPRRRRARSRDRPLDASAPAEKDPGQALSESSRSTHLHFGARGHLHTPPVTCTPMWNVTVFSTGLQQRRILGPWELRRNRSQTQPNSGRAWNHGFMVHPCSLANVYNEGELLDKR
jgi:hypothetical protein